MTEVESVPVLRRFGGRLATAAGPVLSFLRSVFVPVVLVAAMAAVAFAFGRRELLFPEYGALTAGVLSWRLPPWTARPVDIFVLPALAALLGVGLNLSRIPFAIAWGVGLGVDSVPAAGSQVAHGAQHFGCASPAASALHVAAVSARRRGHISGALRHRVLQEERCGTSPQDPAAADPPGRYLLGAGHDRWPAGLLRGATVSRGTADSRRSARAHEDQGGPGIRQAGGTGCRQRHRCLLVRAHS